MEKMIGEMLTFNKKKLEGNFLRNGKIVNVYDGPKDDWSISAMVITETRTHIRSKILAVHDIDNLDSIHLENWGDGFDYFVVMNNVKETDEEQQKEQEEKA